jgi:collagen beta-1,O-galactosyltransferase
LCRIKSDHNEDNSAEILRAWAEDVQDWGKYHSVSVEIIDGPPFRHDDQETPVEWTSKRYQHIMRLKEEAVKVARKIWADYVWVDGYEYYCYL